MDRKPTIRDDDVEAMVALEGTFKGKTALIVSGGPSGKQWNDLYKTIAPDVLICVNGTNAIINNPTFWLCMENMHFADMRAKGGEQRYIDIMEMFNRPVHGQRIVNRNSVKFLDDQEGVIGARRGHVEVIDLTVFDWTKYGPGLINGARMQRPEIIKDLRAGTIGLQALHMATMLGCTTVHTIGYDFMFKGGKDHWYAYPPYEVTRFYNDLMFTETKGVKTMWFWIDTVAFLKKCEPYLEEQGIIWKDYSKGLMTLERLKCTTR
jgi:hypothetical protein